MITNGQWALGALVLGMAVGLTALAGAAFLVAQDFSEEITKIQADPTWADSMANIDSVGTNIKNDLAMTTLAGFGVGSGIVVSFLRTALQSQTEELQQKYGTSGVSFAMGLFLTVATGGSWMQADAFNYIRQQDNLAPES